MSDTLYNARQYIRFTADEFLHIIVTAAIASLILSMRDLLFEHFGEAIGIELLLFTFLFLIVALFVTVWLCKIVAVRLGYTIEYKAHYLGLILGAVICILSAGYLPFFLPGGFTYDQPVRLKIGHWHNYRKGWEVGLIAGSFALIMLLWVLILSPLYIFTRSDFYLYMITAAILTALFACVPAPAFISHTAGNKNDFFRYLRGTTFGLDLAYISRYWWMALCFTVLIFWGMTYLLTVLDERIGLLVFIFSMMLGAFVLWIYHLFFKQQK